MKNNLSKTLVFVVIVGLGMICALAGVDFKEIWQMIHEDKSENKEKYDKIITYILTNESLYY